MPGHLRKHPHAHLASGAQEEQWIEKFNDMKEEKCVSVFQSNNHCEREGHFATRFFHCIMWRFDTSQTDITSTDLQYKCWVMQRKIPDSLTYIHKPQNIKRQSIWCNDEWVRLFLPHCLFLVIRADQHFSAGLNVTHLNKAWWNALLRDWSRDLHMIGECQKKKNDRTRNIPCLALIQTLYMMLAGFLFLG